MVGGPNVMVESVPQKSFVPQKHSAESLELPAVVLAELISLTLSIPIPEVKDTKKSVHFIFPQIDKKTLKILKEALGGHYKNNTLIVPKIPADK